LVSKLVSTVYYYTCDWENVCSFQVGMGSLVVLLSSSSSATYTSEATH